MEPRGRGPDGCGRRYRPHLRPRAAERRALANEQLSAEIGAASTRVAATAPQAWQTCRGRTRLRRGEPQYLCAERSWAGCCGQPASACRWRAVSISTSRCGLEEDRARSKDAVAANAPARAAGKAGLYSARGARRSRRPRALAAKHSFCLSASCPPAKNCAEAASRQHGYCAGQLTGRAVNDDAT